MVKRVLGAVVGVLMVCSLCGCIAVMAGAAGAGTAVWMAGKLSQEVSAPLERTVEAVKYALTSLKLDVRKETVTERVAQVMSVYHDGRTIWIDVHRVSQTMSKVSIRVGATGDKEAARKILDAIAKYIS